MRIEWKIHTKTDEYRKAIKSARTIINKAFSLFDNWAISYSGGKDSTAMLHMILQINPNIKIMTQIDDCDWPEKMPYINQIKELFDCDIHFVKPDFLIWETALNYHLGYEDICKKSHNLTKYGFLIPLENKRKELGCDGVFLGLRKEESTAREKNYITHSHTYKTKENIWYCTPIIHLTTIDVFAYLIENEIPINPCYLKNRFYKPEEIRLSWALPSKHGARFGEIEHIRYYYPEIYQKFKKNKLI